MMVIAAMPSITYTVIGYRLDTGESFVAWVDANRPQEAIAETERILLGDDPPGWEVCAVFAGQLTDLQFG